MYKGRRNPNTDSFGQLQRIELSNKQEAFVEPYLNCRNATEARRCAGYSERSVRAIVRKLPTKANIQARIQERLAEMKMSADKVLMLLTFKLVPVSNISLGLAQTVSILSTFPALKRKKICT